MKEKVFSMFLTGSMVFTMLPVSAMAEEMHTTIDTSGEIIAFAPLGETEKTVSLGISIEDLELPWTLTATVRTAVIAGEQDSGNPDTATATTGTGPELVETTVDISVTWTSQTEYDKDTAGEYLFTTVIEGYTVSTEMPKITVTVGTASMILLTGIATTEVFSFSDLEYAINSAACDLNLKLSDSYSAIRTLIIDENNSYNITIDLNGKRLDGGSKSVIQHNGAGMLTIADSGSEGGGMVSTSGYRAYAIYNNGRGNVEVLGGTVSASGDLSYAIYSNSSGNVEILGGTVSASGDFSYAIYNNSSGNVEVLGGTVSANGDLSYAIYNNGRGNVEVLGGTVSASGDFSYAIYNNSSGNVEVLGGMVSTSGSSTYAIYNYKEGNVTVSGGTIESTAETGTAIMSNVSIYVTSGSSVIKGGGMAMNKGPGFGSSPVQITASANYDGTLAVAYNQEDIHTYKYLKFDEEIPLEGTATVSKVGIDLEYTVAAAELGKTITLEITSSVEIGVLTSDATAAVAAAPQTTKPALSYRLRTGTALQHQSFFHLRYRLQTAGHRIYGHCKPLGKGRY